MTTRFLLTGLLAVLLLGANGCNKSADTSTSTPTADGAKKKKIAFVTNAVDPFWNTAAAGVRAAEKAFAIDCEVLMPPKGPVDQKRMVESLLARGIDGIAISPIDAKNQVDLLNQA